MSEVLVDGLRGEGWLENLARYLKPRKMTAWSGDKISTEMTEYFFFRPASVSRSLSCGGWITN
jgi:hypothetical protein